MTLELCNCYNSGDSVIFPVEVKPHFSALTVRLADMLAMFWKTTKKRDRDVMVQKKKDRSISFGIRATWSQEGIGSRLPPFHRTPVVSARILSLCLVLQITFSGLRKILRPANINISYVYITCIIYFWSFKASLFKLLVSHWT